MTHANCTSRGVVSCKEYGGGSSGGATDPAPERASTGVDSDAGLMTYGLISAAL